MAETTVADVGTVHRVSFRGTVEQGPLRCRTGDLVLLDDAGAAQYRPPAGLRVVRVTYPPRRDAAEATAGLLVQHRPTRLVAIGDGATLDVAKYAWRAAGGTAELVLAPVGAEPWRAFAPFTSLYEPNGPRVSRRDPGLGGARVVLCEQTLAARPEPVVALHRADSVVHGVELLLHTGAGEWSRTLARAGLAAIRGGTGVHPVIGAGLITEAFCGAGLGLAHAIASPLGAGAGRTHDVPNVILAPYVVRYYGERVDWRPVAGVLGTGASAAAVATALDSWRERAGLPNSLRAAGFTREQVRAAVPASLRSSGFPYLPVHTDAAEVAALVERAWVGR